MVFKFHIINGKAGKELNTITDLTLVPGLYHRRSLPGLCDPFDQYVIQQQQLLPSVKIIL